jgi:hypothetical protein
MLKKKLNEFLSNLEDNSNRSFEIITDPAALQLVGGEACGQLNKCGTYSGNDNTCPYLSICGTYTET